MKTILIWIAGLFLVIAAMKVHAQEITILDSSNGLPLEKVTISAINPKLFAITNAAGKASISRFNEEKIIEIRRVGYQSQITDYKSIIEANFIIKLTQSNYALDEVVVSASKWGQSKRDIPGRITSISPKEAELLAPQTAADLLGATGEVFIQKSQQGGGSPMIRGFSTNRLLYTVDGVRMNTAIFRAGNLQNVISLDPLAIENTEVFFGPGSIIYGSDAIGGVMSFTTITPRITGEDTTVVNGKGLVRHATANGEMTVHTDVSIVGEKWASTTSLTHSNYGDLRMGNRGPEEYLRNFFVSRVDSMDRIIANPDPLIQTPTGYNQFNLMQKVRFTPSEKFNFQYAMHVSETSPFSRYDRLIEQNNVGLPRSAVWNYGPQKWYMNQLSVDIKSDNILFDKSTIRLAHQYFEESRIDRNFSGSNRFRLRNQQENVNAISLNADFQKFTNNNSLVYGFEYLENDVQSNAFATDIRNQTSIEIPNRYPNSVWKSVALYATNQFRFSNTVLLQAGLRYSLNTISSDFTSHLKFYPFDFTTSDLQNSAITESIGLVITPDKQTTIHLLGSTGFRAPNVDDIGKIFDFQAGEVIVPNSNLRAEYAYNTEIGIARVFNDRWKIDFTGFYTLLENAMVRRPFQVNGQDSIFYNGLLSRVYAIQNAAKSKIYGFQAAADFQINPQLNLSTNINIQRGQEEMDNGEISTSRHVAPTFGVTRLTYKIKSLQMQIYYIFNDEVSFENLNIEERQKPAIYAKNEEGLPYSPAWQTLNYKMSYEKNDFIITTGVENILDIRYRPYSSGLVAPGRNFVLSISYNF